jgi:drug/metabolite transporter (DMT)-like permease
MQTADRRRGWLLAGIGMLLVSTDSLFIRAADFDAWTIAFVFGVASTMSLSTAFLVTSSEPFGVAARRAPLALLGVALLSSATQIAFTAAVNNTAVSNVVVIVGATPIAAAVMARVLLRERAERRVVVAIAATTAGILVVVSGSVGSPTLDGDLLALLAVAMFSLSVVIWRRHPDLNRPLALATSSATMALIAAPFASLDDAPLRVFLAAGAMGLIFNPLGRISYTSAPRHAPVAEVALFTPVETVAATAWAWIFFSEVPGLRTVIGGIVVVAAVLHGTVGSSRAGALVRRTRSTTPPSGPEPVDDASA